MGVGNLSKFDGAELLQQGGIDIPWRENVVQSSFIVTILIWFNEI